MKPAIKIVLKISLLVVAILLVNMGDIWGSSVTFGLLAMAIHEYKYRCPKCGGIFTYSQPGNYYCPTDEKYRLVRN